MKKQSPNQLSRRERQVMDLIYELGDATAADIQEQLPDAPGNSAVRYILRMLEENGLITHKRLGHRFVYRSTEPRGVAQESALQHVLRTFFDGSTERAVSAMLEMQSSRLTTSELERIEAIVNEMKEEGH